MKLKIMICILMLVLLFGCIKYDYSKEIFDCQQKCINANLTYSDYRITDNKQFYVCECYTQGERYWAKKQ
jgi:hypothetical protein